MWFKRRKKTEQDHALSQSLKSLQSLLNETDDRREPSLDPLNREPEGGTAPEHEVDEGNGGVARDTILREPSPPDSASRWRDLNLSFDAEPVETVSAPPEEDDNPPTVEADDAEPTVDDAPDEPVIESPAPGEPESTDKDAHQPGTTASPPDEYPAHDTDAMPLDDTLETSPAEPAPQASDPGAVESTVDPETEPRLDNTVDLESFSTPSREEPLPPAYEDEADEDEPENGANDIEWDEPTLPAIEPEAIEPEVAGPDVVETEAIESLTLEAVESDPLQETTIGADLPDTPAVSGDRTPKPAAGGDKREENQLNLELEPLEGAEDDIPTLTEAVYVPDTPVAPTTEAPETETATTEPASPVSDETDARGTEEEDNLERNVERLRERLQSIDLDALTPAQQTRLRVILNEMTNVLREDDTDSY